MNLRFDANQEYQIRAIEAVADLFEGQPRSDGALDLALGSYGAGYAFAAIPNRLDLTEDALLANLGKVQAANGLTVDGALETIEQQIETPAGPRVARFPNFSVEMETGTGKTYVYLRTALELHRRYSFRKFIVVVPSVAIREGVLKTLQITEKHLRELYGNVPYRYTVYYSANLSQIRQFALADSVEIMVMTIDSFNKDSNVIRQSTDRLQGETPIHLVQAARPILILDEPQDMESELRIKALSMLDPLFALRYSATHRNPYNLVYRLTPFEAYRQGLVKRIEVAGIEREGDENRPFLRLDAVNTAKNTVTARIAVHRLQTSGQVKEQVVTVRPGDSLEQKANRPEYAPYAVEEIDISSGSVLFTSGLELRLGQSQGADKASVFEAQIRYTIEEHFRRQTRLKDRGIKVLSLFFVDRVDNYASQDGLIRKLFNKSFDDLRKRYPDWQSADPESVQAAYFATRKTRSGEVVYEDTRTGEAERDKEAYNLIMRDKERLLSLDEPTCFIFSHSALGKGWDSPNVFQICTLNQTASEMKKRQEIGRGVRLAVNQDGFRVKDDQVNVLTVVANESYESYVGRYQTEIQEEFGLAGTPPKPGNARTRLTAHLRKQYLLRDDFKELWERISRKTRYAVKIDSEKLIADVVRDLDHAEIRPPQIVLSKARLRTAADGASFTTIQLARKVEDASLASDQLPNVLEVIASTLERTTPPMRLTRRTLLDIYNRTTKQAEALTNPYEFANVTAQLIRRHLTDQLVDGIEYQKINEWYEMTQFQADVDGWDNYLVPTGRSLYDYVAVDSQSDDPLDSVEGRFVLDMEQRDDVKLYVKLPDWFKVETPIGAYNPDWAIVMEPRDEFGDPTGEERLYLVRETKGTSDIGSLRPDESRKVRCGQKHFRDALGVDYKVVTDASQLP